MAIVRETPKTEEPTTIQLTIEQMAELMKAERDNEVAQAELRTATVMAQSALGAYRSVQRTIGLDPDSNYGMSKSGLLTLDQSPRPATAAASTIPTPIGNRAGRRHPKPAATPEATEQKQESE